MFAQPPTQSLELAQNLELRMEAIYASRKPGIEYFVALLLQTYVPAVIHARENPECCLSDLYKAGVAPDQQQPRFAIEAASEFMDVVRSAISDSAGSVALASVRFVRKVLRAKVSSIRYLNQHTTAMLAMKPDTTDHKLVVAFAGHALLGSLPHATCIAPPSVIIEYFENPVAATAKVIRIVGSKGLYSLLAEYISEVTHQYPDVYALMERLEHGRLPKPSDKWLRAADEAVRPVMVTNFHGETSTSRRQLKSIPQPPIVDTIAPDTFMAQKAARGIKRKLAASITEKVPPLVLSEIYKTAIARVPRKPRLPAALVASTAERYNVDPDTITTIFLHAIEQRGSFSVTRASSEVTKAQRKAHGGSCPVKICVWCHSIRTSPPAGFPVAAR